MSEQTSIEIASKQKFIEDLDYDERMAICNKFGIRTRQQMNNIIRGKSKNMRVWKELYLAAKEYHSLIGERI